MRTQDPDPPCGLDPTFDFEAVAQLPEAVKLEQNGTPKLCPHSFSAGAPGSGWFPLKSGVFFSQTYSDLFELIRTLFTSTRLFASTAQNNLFQIIFTYYSSTYSCYSLEAE